MTIQVRCIKRTSGHEPHERILGIGGTDGNGSHWYLPEPEAIEGIESGELHLYMNVAGLRARIIVAARLGQTYLRTDRDDEQPDDLLRLPECP